MCLAGKQGKLNAFQDFVFLTPMLLHLCYSALLEHRSQFLLGLRKTPAGRAGDVSPRNK